MALTLLGDNGVWHQVLDAVPDHVALIDSGGTIIGVNAAWERF